MTMEHALALVRDGRVEDAVAELANLTGHARTRLELALALKRGQAANAAELAARLWYACEVDDSVLAALVQHRHAELKDVAGELLRQRASDAAYDVTDACTRLAARPEDVNDWRDVLASLIARGRTLQAVDGVARALSERIGNFELWTMLATQLMAQRQRAGLIARSSWAARRSRMPPRCTRSPR